MSQLKVMKLPQLNMVVIKQEGGHDFFISAPDAIIISVTSLAFLIKFLAENNYVNIKVLEGIVEDVRNQNSIA